MKPELKNELRAELKNALYIAAGLLFTTLAYNLYLIPNSVVSGGFTGIGMLVNHFFPVIGVGTVNLCLNIPMFLISMNSLGWRFGIRSLLVMFLFSLFIDIIPLPRATDDLLLAAVYGGVLSGLGFGLILRGSATTGGTDMLASVVHRFLPILRVSWGIFLFDGLIIVASIFVFDSQAAMYGLISAFITNFLVDLVLEGPNSAHSYFIISDKSEEIAAQVLKELDRGVTGFEAMGMYHHTRKKVLLCVVGRFETMRLRRVVFSVDPRAFVVANKASEVLGEGFKEAKQNP